MPGSIIRQVQAEVAIGKIKGKALAAALDSAAKTANNKKQGKKK